MVKYKYDAWGNCKVLNANGTEITDSNNIGILNPFRYRSYYYDTETNLYFLKTRYYDPEIGRFMTIDDINYLDPESINGLNLYAYCSNNPVMGYDPNGTWEGYHWLGLIGAILVVAAATVLTCGAAGVAIGGAGLAGAVIHGAAVGALVGAGIGVAGGVAAGAIYSVTTGADLLSSIGIGAMAGFGFGAIIGAVVGGAISGISNIVSPLSTTKIHHPIGNPFNPNQSIQIGVDPNTLKISRALNPNKYSMVKQKIKKDGMYGVIEVMRDGTIIDGNHRVAVAKLLKIAVDVVLR